MITSCQKTFDSTLEQARIAVQEVAEMHLTFLSGYISALYQIKALDEEEYDSLLGQILEVREFRSVYHVGYQARAEERSNENGDRTNP